MALYTDVRASAYPAPVHRRDGRQEPGHRQPQRRPRRGGRGHHALAPSASAARSARPTAGSTSSDPSTTSSSACSSRRPRRSRSATRCGARTGWARSSTSKAQSTRYQRAVARGAPRRAVFDRRRARSPTSGLDARLLRRAHGRGRPAGRPSALPRRAVRCPSPPSTRSTRSTRRSAWPTVVYGLTAGIYSEDQAEVERFLERIEAGVALRQPARRRDDRRLAGRPALRRLEGLGLDGQGRPGGCSTWPSSCASRATPSSTEGRAAPGRRCPAAYEKGRSSDRPFVLTERSAPYGSTYPEDVIRRGPWQPSGSGARTNRGGVKRPAVAAFVERRHGTHGCSHDLDVVAAQ